MIDTVALIAYFVIGKLLIWTLQTADPVKWLYRMSSFTTELFECDFCLGCWVYTAIGFIMDLNIFSPKLSWMGLNLHPIGIIVTAIGASFLMHLISLGWTTKFGTIHVE